VKYIYNPVTNDLDEIEKIPDLEDRLEKGIADKEARDSGWKDTKELEDYLSRDTSGSKGAWDKYVKETAHNEKVDQEIVNFGDNFQPNKKPIKSGKYDPNEWVMHIAAMYGGEESKKFEKDLIEDVQIQPNGELRGMLTGKNYDAKEAIKMNEKYDRNFTNPEVGKDKQTYLTANEKVLANFNPQEALKYTNGGKDQENVKYMRYVKAKAKRINSAAILKDKKENPKKFKKENDKLFESILDNLGTNKTAMLTEEQKKDPKIIEMPLPDFGKEIEKMEKEKEKEKETYKIRLPRDPMTVKFEKMMLESDLEKEANRMSGIGKFDQRARFAGGGNGSTPKTPQTYQKQIEDLYGIQLTGQETIAELLELVKELKNDK
jgi:hypothetical protein|tara:strand:+ start:1724 stop:2851 length:1128 start_codon:yes stop_codon:yes gene_type:complete